MAETTDKNKNVLASEDEANVDYSTLQKDSQKKDEYEGVDVNSKFKLGLARNLISLKNHVSTIPLIMTIASMVLLTCCLHAHNDAVRRLTSSVENFLVFVDVLLSILSALCYINVQGKHQPKNKVIMMSVFYYIVMIAQLIIDYHLIHEFNVEMGMVNGGITGADNIGLANTSISYFKAHIVLLYISMGLAVAAPIVQPFTKKIRIRL